MNERVLRTGPMLGAALLLEFGLCLPATAQPSTTVQVVQTSTASAGATVVFTSTAPSSADAAQDSSLGKSPLSSTAADEAPAASGTNASSASSQSPLAIHPNFVSGPGSTPEPAPSLAIAIGLLAIIGRTALARKKQAVI